MFPAGETDQRAGPPGLRELRAGRDDAWTSFRAYFLRFSSRLISRWFGDCPDPEELQDHLLCRITRVLVEGRGPSSPEALGPWLTGAVRNSCATGIREKASARERALPLARAESRAGPPRPGAFRESSSLPGLQAVTRLLPRGEWRSVLRLRCRRKPWSYERIAILHGANPATVRCWALRARRFLQGLPPSVLRRPSEYLLVPRGRAYVPVRERPSGTR